MVGINRKSAEDSRLPAVGGGGSGFRAQPVGTACSTYTPNVFRESHPFDVPVQPACGLTRLQPGKEDQERSGFRQL